MNREHKDIPIHGWLNIDKPSGTSSSNVVARVKRSLGAAKAGHAGTLDPLATGVLPIALGEATKTVSYAMNSSKTYQFALRFGVATSTDDTEGKPIKTSDFRPSRSNIEDTLKNFTGIIEQIPPIYSAIKVNGRRAYELARQLEHVNLLPRKIRIDNLELLDLPDANNALFEVTSGKGTYVRALARDMALALGTVGHISWLRRITVGVFQEDVAISLDKLETLGHSAANSDFLLPVETVLADIPALSLTTQEANRLQHGQRVSVMPLASQSSFKDICQGDTICAMAKGKLVALAKLAGREIRPVRVMNF